MAMGSIGEAFLAASSFLGFGLLRSAGEAGRGHADGGEAFGDRDYPALPALGAFDPGEPYFQAVARALDEAGYIEA